MNKDFVIRVEKINRTLLLSRVEEKVFEKSTSFGHPFEKAITSAIVFSYFYQNNVEIYWYSSENSAPIALNVDSYNRINSFEFGDGMKILVGSECDGIVPDASDIDILTKAMQSLHIGAPQLTWESRTGSNLQHAAFGSRELLQSEGMELKTRQKKEKGTNSIAWGDIALQMFLGNVDTLIQADLRKTSVGSEVSANVETMQQLTFSEVLANANISNDTFIGNIYRLKQLLARLNSIIPMGGVFELKLNTKASERRLDIRRVQRPSQISEEMRALFGLVH